MTGPNRWSDANALAGPLHDVFRLELSTAVGRCGGCGRTTADEQGRGRACGQRQAKGCCLHRPALKHTAEIADPPGHIGVVGGPMSWPDPGAGE
jgi:hypothetical protein